MVHLPAFLLCVAGFAALALAMSRHQRDLLGRALPPVTNRMLRAGAACVLAAAFGMLVAAHGWALGLVMFSGHTSMAAGLVLLVMIGHAQIKTRKAQQRTVR